MTNILSRYRPSAAGRLSILAAAAFLSAALPLSAQELRPEHVMKFFLDGADTVYVADLPPAVVFDFPGKAKGGREWREFYRTVHNFAKTYPYALLAKQKLDLAENYLQSHDLNRREREKYLSEFQAQLFYEFEQPLRNLTFTQGRILLRLIERETGISSYYIIRNYRGGAAAGFWQGVAKLFGADLKKPYDRFGEDRLLEELVQLYRLEQFDQLYVAIFGRYPPKLPLYHYGEGDIPSPKELKKKEREQERERKKQEKAARKNTRSKG